MGHPTFKIQKQMPEKHGTMKKKGRIFGGWLQRWYKMDWNGNTAMLLSFKNPQMAGQPTKTVSLEHCNVRPNQALNKLTLGGYCLEVDTTGGG